MFQILFNESRLLNSFRLSFSGDIQIQQPLSYSKVYSCKLYLSIEKTITNSLINTF